MKPHILIIEDDRNAGRALVSLLSREGHQVSLAASGDEGLALALETPFDLVLSDIVMPGMDGMALFRRLRRDRPEMAIIMMTAHGTIEMAVEAMREGAADFLEKPLNIDRVRVQVAKALAGRELAAENRRLRARLQETFALDNLLGEDPQVLRLAQQVRQVAPTDLTVLILGESGTGKELVANSLHELSNRRSKPFIKINCAALPEDLLSSELFGHTKGAFTGAAGTRKGRFEEADGGTIFLDEIGDLPAAMQVKLLRVLQEGTFERVGDNATRHVDVRLITATHVDLEAALRDGRMREDFFYRIKGLTLKFPALRERRGDIPLLARHFLAARAPQKKFTDEALAVLKNQTWPGNVRQLKNICDNLAVLSAGDEIQIGDLPAEIRSETPSHPISSDTEFDTLSLDEVEQQLIFKALEATRGNKTEAARRLGIGLRTLYRKLEQYQEK